MSILAIDVGNTNIVLGIYQQQELQCHWRIATRADTMADEFAVLFEKFFSMREVNIPNKAIISSVVPRIDSQMALALEHYWQIASLHIHADSIAPILSVETDNPREVGADFLANTVAAMKFAKAATIVVDFGTATKLSLSLEPNRFMGVSIAPGAMTAANALFRKGALLPDVKLEAPPYAVGTNTIHSLQSGLVLGHAAMVDGLVAHFCKEIPSEYGEPFVVATGGFATVMDDYCHSINHVAPLLTLDGLAQAARQLNFI